MTRTGESVQPLGMPFGRHCRQREGCHSVTFGELAIRSLAGGTARAVDDAERQPAKPILPKPDTQLRVRHSTLSILDVRGYSLGVQGQDGRGRSIRVDTKGHR